MGSIVERNRIFALKAAYGALTLGGETGTDMSGNTGALPEGVALVARNNLIVGIQDSPYCVLFQGCQDCALVNNLIAGCAATRDVVLIVKKTPGQEVLSSNIRIANNLVVASSADRALTVKDNNQMGLTMECNLYDKSFLYSVDESGLYLDDMKTAGWESGSFMDAPFFADAATGDYHLLAGSPGVDQGCPQVGLVTSDFDGATRPQGAGWDIGPYER